MFKLMIVGRRRGGMTVAQLHRYMVEEHGAMVVRYIGERPDETPKRYVQNHVFDSTFRVPDGSADPFMVSRDFVTQVWFDSPAQAAASLQAPFYRELLQPDEDRFVDQGSVVKLPVVEQPVFGNGASRGSHKLLVFHRCAPGATADDLAAATLALWQPLLDDAAHGIEALVRNAVMSRPGEPAPAADLVDEVWLKDDSAVRSLGQRWQAMEEASSVAPRSTFVLLAHERVLFAGLGS